MDKILKILQRPTEALKVGDFQMILNCTQNIQKQNTHNKMITQVFACKAIELLWNHLRVGLITNETQSICATAFFTILILQEDLADNLMQVSNVISKFVDAKKKKLAISEQKTLLTVGLMYGLFQSPFISLVLVNLETIRDILEKSFEILNFMAYEYSKFTFLTFKTLQSLRKTLQSNFMDFLLTEQKQIKLLSITCYNWENPITGVRDINKTIFGLLIDITHLMESECSYDKIIREINGFPWNKAKYLMLSEIILKETKCITALFAENSDWMNGLVDSLSSSGLVSAGSDMYYALLKKINTDTDWCNMFLEAVLDILKGDKFKAIENFNNYWCRDTLKLFPELMVTLTRNLLNFKCANILYAHLSILRQGNKLGLLPPWSSVSSVIFLDASNIVQEDISFLQTVVCGLEHLNVNIRIQTFEMCISHTNRLPTKTQTQLILKFIKENVNSDSTVLRLNMLNNMKQFFTRLHTSIINIMKMYKQKDVQKQHVASATVFLYDLDLFIMCNLKTQGNYQRNITITKLCEMLKSFLNKPLRTTGYTSKQWLTEITSNEFTLADEDRLIDYLVGLLEDPADDVRETASKILFENYAHTFDDVFIRKLILMALKNIHSKFFYKVSNGHCIMRLVSNLLIELKSEELRLNIMFNEFFNDVMSEIDNQDILMSIENGRQLHSLICILQNILEVCLDRTHPLNSILTCDVKETLITKLSELPKSYTVKESTITSPDFSEISDMVDKLISESACKVRVETRDVKISDLHQIVLKSIWLNLKACCDLSCIIVKCIDKDEDLKYSEICLHIITDVLETFRHKGAIEAAGVALGKTIRYLTSLPKNLELSKLPLKLLEKKLNELTGDTNKMGSITRRGAGLSIMLHKIVSNDLEKGKPLFHCTMRMLLQACSLSPDSKAIQDITNERDIPKAIYMHLMTNIVADSSLASDVMFYSAELAKVAFRNLTSELWQIRNAALQLYGALVTKLIGQKKSSSCDQNSAATVGCDELRTHSPKLWSYIQRQLRCHRESNDVQAHSNLVPILNLLGSTAKRYRFSYDHDDSVESDRELFVNLMTLLNSPIYSVRRLTAKSIDLMFSFEEVANYILKVKTVSENLLHGFLLVIQLCKERITGSNTFLEIDKIEELENYFSNIIQHGRHSYVVMSIYDKTFSKYGNNLVKKVVETIKILDKDKSAPGSYLWAGSVITKCIEICTPNELPLIVRHCMNLNELEVYCDCILKRINVDTELETETLKEIATILIQSELRFQSGGLWKILFKITLITTVCFNRIDLTSVATFLVYHNFQIPLKIRYMIPFQAKVLISDLNKPACDILDFSKVVYSFTDYETVDVDVRHIAAITNNIFAYKIKEFTFEVKMNLLKSALNLLQDDDEDIRLEAAHFYSNATNKQFVFQPYICLEKILNHDFMNEVFENNTTNVLTFAMDCIREINKINRKDDECYNPFLIESRNIYAEPQIFESLLNNLISKIKSDKAT